MAGFNLSIGADTRGFSSAIKSGLINPLEDVEDAIDKASKSGDKVGEGLEEGMRKAQRETKDARDDLDTLQNTIKDVNKAAKNFGVDGAKDIGDGVRRGTDDAKEGFNELKDESKSSGREAAASFSGEFSDVGDLIQELAANVFSGFGPAGVIAGIAAAAGIGLVIAQFEKAGESSEAFKARVSELTQELIDVGDGAVGVEYIVDKLKEMATATDDAETSLSDLRDVADKSGGSYEDLAKAVAGAGEDLDKLIESEKARKKALEETNEEEQKGLAYRDKVGGDDPRIEQTQKYIEYLEQAKAAQNAAAENEKNYADANGPALAAKAELISNINDSYDEAAGGAEDFLDKETGIFDVQGFIDSMAQREQALRDYQETLATAALSPDAKAFISSQGVDSAATFLAGYKTATPAQQAELNRIWSEAGKTSSGTFSSNVRANLSQAGYAATVKLNPDGSNIQQYLNQTKTQNVLLRVQNRIDLPANQGMGVP